ncbi:hypothetical protein MASR2M78_22520 [Treponema sp.]
MSPGRSHGFGATRHVWRESYTHDANGNRATKTTDWGTITYQYDAENRLISRGSIAYAYDKDGNLLSEAGLRRKATYEYTSRNRMSSSEIVDPVKKDTTVSHYEYDAFGRRTITGVAGILPSAHSTTGFLLM